MAGKAQLPRTSVDEIVKANKERKKQFGRERSLFAGIPQLLAVNGIGLSHSATGGLIIPIQGLPTSGGPMMGPIAFHPTTTGIVSGVLDIAKTTSAFSSRVIVLGQENPDNLCRITGAAHAGQILFLQAVSTTAIVLKHLTDESPAVGNIYMPSGNDYTVAGKEIVLLQWDTINPPAGTEYGQWTLVATSGGGLTNPMTEDLDMGNNDITNTNNYYLTREDGTARMAILGGSGTTSQVLFDAVSGTDIRFTEGLVDKFTLTLSGGTDVADLKMNLVSQDIVPEDNNNKDLGSADDKWRYIYGGTSNYFFHSSYSNSIDMNDNPVVDVGEINFTNSSTSASNTRASITGSSDGDMVCNVPDGEAIFFEINDVTKFTVQPTTSFFHTNVDPTTTLDYDLGTTGKVWDKGYIHSLIEVSDITGEDDSIINFVGGSIQIQAASGALRLMVGGSSKLVVDGDGLSLGVHSTPSTLLNGMIWNDGTDVYVRTGSLTKSMTDIGSGGGGGSPFAESLLPTDTDTYDLGSSAKQWQNLYIDGVAVVDQISCSGQIDGGAITASGALYGGTTLTAVGATYLNGAVTLGDASGDDINVKGKLDFINNFSTQYYASHPAVTGYITVNTPDGSKNLWFS